MSSYHTLIFIWQLLFKHQEFYLRVINKMLSFKIFQLYYYVLILFIFHIFIFNSSRKIWSARRSGYADCSFLCHAGQSDISLTTLQRILLLQCLRYFAVHLFLCNGGIPLRLRSITLQKAPICRFLKSTFPVACVPHPHTSYYRSRFKGRNIQILAVPRHALLWLSREKERRKRMFRRCFISQCL
jgi:hypothetical protein